MSLLSIEHVTKRYRRGRLERVAVRDVSLDIDPGELFAVWGARFSGRSTLLRIAAGIESPEQGSVFFEGRDLAPFRDSAPWPPIGYCQTASPLLAAGSSSSTSRPACSRSASRPGRRVGAGRRLLFRVGAEQLRTPANATSSTARSSCGWRSRARSSTEPALLVIDEPTSGVELLQRDPLLALLRSIANEGTAVLMSTGDAQGLSGVDRALTIDNGELRGAVARAGYRSCRCDARSLGRVGGERPPRAAPCSNWTASSSTIRASAARCARGRRRDARDRARRDRRAARSQRLRQEHAADARRRADGPGRRRGPLRGARPRHPLRGRSRRLPAPQDRLRLPVLPPDGRACRRSRTRRSSCSPIACR